MGRYTEGAKEEMTYGFTTLATDLGADTWQVKTIRAALFFIPKASPDNESKYPQVRRWLLEIDDTGVPVREIGLSDRGPLFGAPDCRNVGFWTDSNKIFSKEELDLTTQSEFEQLWEKIKTKSGQENPVPSGTSDAKSSGTPDSCGL